MFRHEAIERAPRICSAIARARVRFSTRDNVWMTIPHLMGHVSPLHCKLARGHACFSLVFQKALLNTQKTFASSNAAPPTSIVQTFHPLHLFRHAIAVQDGLLRLLPFIFDRHLRHRYRRHYDDVLEVLCTTFSSSSIRER